MGKAWIEGTPRTGPWRIRWREKSPEGTIKKPHGPWRGNREDVDSDKAAKDQELAQASQRARRSGLITIADLLKQRAADKVSSSHNRTSYALEFTQTITALALENAWSTTQDITAQSVYDWVQGRRKKRVPGKRKFGTGTEKQLQILKTFLRWASAPPLVQPVDRDVLAIARRRAQGRSPPPLLDDDQVTAIMARAYALGEPQGAIVDHLLRFGPRPVDLCRLLVRHWHRKARTLHLATDKNGNAIAHPIDGPHEDFAKRLDRITQGRAPDEALYLNPYGEAWTISPRGSAQQLTDWYWYWIADHLSLLRTQRGIYCLKDYAITRMEAADIPDADKALFTGHLDLSSFQRYKSTNQRQARLSLDKIPRPPGVVGTSASGGQIGGHFGPTGGKSGGSATVAIVPDAVKKPANHRGKATTAL